MSETITIDGIAFPVSDFETAITTLREGIKGGKSAQEIFDSLGPALLPPIETLLNYICPGAGTGLELIELAVKNAIPFWNLPQSEQNRIQDQQGSSGVSV